MEWEETLALTVRRMNDVLRASMPSLHIVLPIQLRIVIDRYPILVRCERNGNQVPCVNAAKLPRDWTPAMLAPLQTSHADCEGETSGQRTHCLARFHTRKDVRNHGVTSGRRVEVVKPSAIDPPVP